MAKSDKKKRALAARTGVMHTECNRRDEKKLHSDLMTGEPAGESSVAMLGNTGRTKCTSGNAGGYGGSVSTQGVIAEQHEKRTKTRCA